jgi:hypothetical protein
VLAVAFPDAQLQILPYNRLIRDLAGHTPEGCWPCWASASA